MPITFESIKDPYGIRNAGSVLGQAMMQKSQEELQNQRQLELEQRGEQRGINKENRLLNRQNSALSGLDLLDKDLSLESQRAFLKKNAESGGGIEDGLTILKQLNDQKIANLRQQNTPETTFDKEEAKNYSKYLTKVSDTSNAMKSLEREMPALQEAVMQNDPSFLKSWTIGTLKKIGMEGTVLNANEQTISSVVKSVVSELEKGGARMSVARLKFIEAASPSPEKSKEANIAGYNILNRMVKLGASTGDIVNQIREENPNISRRELEQQVQERLDQEFSVLEEEGKNLLQEAGVDVGSKNAKDKTYDDLNKIKAKDGMEVTDEETGKVYVFKKGKWTATK